MLKLLWSRNPAPRWGEGRQRVEEAELSGRGCWGEDGQGQQCRGGHQGVSGAVAH